jgi:hypothetical protein
MIVYYIALLVIFFLIKQNTLRLLIESQNTLFQSHLPKSYLPPVAFAIEIYESLQNSYYIIVDLFTSSVFCVRVGITVIK